MKPRLHTLLFIINLACTIVCSAQNHGTVYKQPKLKGKVKSLTETVYMHMHKANNPEEGSMRWVWCLKQQYDTLGNNILITGYSKTGSELYTDTIPHNSYGNPTVRYYHRAGKRSQTLYKYDDKGQLIAAIDYNETGRLNHRIYYTYNTNGNCTSWTQTDSAGLTKSYTTFVYDSAYNVIEEIDSSFTSKSKTIKRFYYDAIGLIILELRNTYDAYAPTFQFQRTYTYDKYGNILSDTSKEASPDPNIAPIYAYSYKYRYDKSGNWVERKTYNDGKLVGRDIHEIEYY